MLSSKFEKLLRNFYDFKIKFSYFFLGIDWLRGGNFSIGFCITMNIDYHIEYKALMESIYIDFNF